MIRSYSEHAANERTFLAWVRTAIAVIAFGFVIEKFDLFVLTMANANSPDSGRRLLLQRLSGPLWRYDGLALILVGLALMVVAALRFCPYGRLLDGRGKIAAMRWPTYSTSTRLSAPKRSAAASRPWGARWSTSSLTTSVGLSPSPTFCFRNKSSLPRNWPERWTRSRRATPSRRRLAEQPLPDRPWWSTPGVRRKCHQESWAKEASGRLIETLWH